MQLWYSIFFLIFINLRYIVNLKNKMTGISLLNFFGWKRIIYTRMKKKGLKFEYNIMTIY